MTGTLPVAIPSEFAYLVREGLTREGQKQLPSKLLYDDVGSALFDVICLLPEYGLTRAEERILSRHMDEIVRDVPRAVAVAELGSGTGRKTRLVLRALCRGRHQFSYYPIEISRSALTRCERELSDVPCARIEGLEREYLEGLGQVAARRREGQHLLILFLGSTIGNFDGQDGEQFLRQLRGIICRGDFLLLGADLQKPVDRLLAAYDDAIGVTAAFNLNVLTRINRELGSDFDLNRFAHRAIFNEETSSIEMHLCSRDEQVVRIPGADLAVEFARNETIWTENCHKYSLDELQVLAASTGFRPVGRWLDSEWPFAENLWVAV